MYPDILIQSPFRSPRWRLERVLEMIRHRPQPLPETRSDDHSIRIYRRILLAVAAAGDDESRRDEIHREYPEICHAHSLHYSPDVETRQILDASLLTCESFTEIADRFGTQARTIEYYEALFFNVRDRMSNKFWIQKVIRGTFDVGRDKDKDRRAAQRGYVLRLFAHFGGPRVLDAMIQGLAVTQPPQNEKELSSWLEASLGQLVRSSAAAAASTLEMNPKNMMETIRLALRADAAAAKTGSESPSTQYEKAMEKILASINWSIAGG